MKLFGVLDLETTFRRGPFLAPDSQRQQQVHAACPPAVVHVFDTGLASRQPFRISTSIIQTREAALIFPE
jgi:hypothetical protein